MTAEQGARTVRSTGLWRQTDPARRSYGTAALVGVIVGVIGAIVKFGWEVPFPPRTPARNATNPPQELLQQLGFSPDFTHLTYTFSDNHLPYISFIIHIGFSVAVAIFYCVVAERFPAITLWQGAVFGFLVWVGFHLILMPFMGTVPAPWDQPFAEHFSECFGHIFWLWVMELCRRDLRNRFTHEPDPDELPTARA